jgi:hypothetical protein
MAMLAQLGGAARGKAFKRIPPLQRRAIGACAIAVRWGHIPADASFVYRRGWIAGAEWGQLAMSGWTKDRK